MSSGAAREGSSDTARVARVIAFYLPQFHPIPENDEWWGKGFTEWTNVTKAKSLFRGHYQPHVSADLGFYDLRVPETRLAQAEMASRYGVEAFCYWHYWFAGRRILERPFEEVLKSGQPNFPFCLAWANETWTGIWHGSPDKILIEQTYPGPDDYRAHFRALLPAFSDPRYVTVDGKPLFHVFKPHQLPNARQFSDIWRDMALEAGLPGLYLVGHSPQPRDPREWGFDAIEGSAGLPPRIDKRPWYRPLKRLRWHWKTFRGRPTVYQYEDVCETIVEKWAKETEHLPRHLCLLPNWDNTPRSGTNGLVLHDSTPELFRRQLRKAFQLVAREPFEHRIVFLKSWNEWAEGNYLEPDMRLGHGYLEALKAEVLNVATVRESGTDAAITSTSPASTPVAMRLSVVIQTRARPIELGHLLWSLFWQRRGADEIVVVDWSSNNDAETVVNRLLDLCKAVHGGAPELVYLHDPAILVTNAARNIGINASTGDVVLLLDDDKILDSDFVHQLLQVYANDPGVGSVSGVVTNSRAPSFGTRVAKKIFWRGPFRDEASRTSSVMSVRRTTLATDRFVETLSGLPQAEDVDLCYRLAARAKLVVTPRARAMDLACSSRGPQAYWLQTNAHGTHYAHRHHLRTGLKNRVSFAWLNLGYVLMASAASIRTGSLEPLRALLSGIRRASGSLEE